TRGDRTALRVSHPHDPAEVQAHAAADVVARGGSVAGWSFGSVATTAPVHREETAKPAEKKDDKEKYTEAAGKVVEAALETDAGKKVKELVLADPLIKTTTKFFTTPLGIGTGALLAGGALTGLAAAKQPLPLPLPAVPLGGIHPALAGVSAQVKIDGPLNAPTFVGLTLTFGGGASSSAMGKEGSVQREPAGSESDSAGVGEFDTASVATAQASPGRALDPSVRRRMEGRFGQDFSAVRLHDDAAGQAAALGVRARAWTLGQHVGFAPGEYRPGSPEGDHLLAHELAHVVQQGGAGRRSAIAPVLHRQAAGTGATPTQAPGAERDERFNVGRGGHLMDAVLDRRINWLTAVMKVRFNFVNTPQAWPSPAAQTQWQHDFVEKVTDRWSFKHFLVPEGAGPQAPRTVVRVQVRPVSSGQHYTANVGYTTSFATSSVNRGAKTATLDALDTTVRSDIDQTPVEHEFGHMLGLGHIAGDTNDAASYGVTATEKADILGTGSYVSPRDYQVFAELMPYFTGQNHRVVPASFIPTTGGATP
ncbi:eCIS core domain-containing protein, partial [Kribbia dieselivorans]|uniref:eCIS core domain-containing protein n=1 Tax=Kribbia dieselivorans TaxID=331526 RepID=UPI000A6B3867